jgi:hypothetical protein
VVVLVATIGDEKVLPYDSASKSKCRVFQQLYLNRHNFLSLVEIRDVIITYSMLGDIDIDIDILNSPVIHILLIKSKSIDGNKQKYDYKSFNKTIINPTAWIYADIS